MKKYLFICFVLFLFLFVSCNNKNENKNNIEDVKIIVDSRINNIVPNERVQVNYHLEPSSSLDVLITSSDENIISVIDNNELLGICDGEATIKIELVSNPNVFVTFIVNVYTPSMTKIIASDTLTIPFNEIFELDYSILPNGAINDCVITSGNSKVVEVIDNKNIKGIKLGEIHIRIESSSNKSVYKEIRVIVTPPLAKEIVLESKEFDLELGLGFNIPYSVLPNEAFQDVNFLSDSNDLYIKDNYILAYKSGTFNVTIKTIDGSNLSEDITINVKQEDKPVFRYSEDFNLNEEVGWNTNVLLYKGISAYDSEDGDITDKIKVDGYFDPETFGSYEITYSVTDSDKNKSSITRIINVVWNYNTMVIGHAGSYYGVMNSEEAIMVGARDMHYPAIEIDVKQTKDGVFVLSHDPEFGGYNLEDYSYEFLKDIKVTVTRNKGIVPLDENDRTYTATLCTLERFLEICKEYGVIAVIELKTSNGISNWTETHNPTGSRMPALMEIVNKLDMSHNIIFLSNQYECLYWTRKNGYDYIPCQYLVNDLSNIDYLNICKEYDLDISTNVRDGIVITDEWLNLYKEAGIKISTYTFEEYASYADVQKWIDRGVDFVTVDWHDMHKLKFS